ncbi:hypothetical protein NDU88_003918 [Pleurodeles waltl]|uniref:Uncharacterized protein n=1 Tax=Pleurodeles waltl TaxID=8319 RepID=A0AAV7L363_PLEWA|nr:hypothetical protein NDU88_003918 [Pleurodeles waltl]
MCCRGPGKFVLQKYRAGVHMATDLSSRRVSMRCSSRASDGLCQQRSDREPKAQETVGQPQGQPSEQQTFCNTHREPRAQRTLCDARPEQRPREIW